jgi:thioredoxin-related protein
MLMIIYQKPLEVLCQTPYYGYLYIYRFFNLTIMKIKLILLAGALIVTGLLRSQTTSEPADKIVMAASRLAATENKNVMIVFHASWCGWCRKFEASISDSACKDFFERSYVVRYLTVLESEKNKNDENTGAIDLFNKYGGKGSGLPYFLIFDDSGKLLANSKMKVTNPVEKEINIGCPASDQEVDAFIEIVKRTSKITDKEIAAIKERFKKNMPNAK